MKILFINLPYYGHVIPTIGLVKELMRQGVEVTYMLPYDWEDKIKDSGALFVGYHNHKQLSEQIKNAYSKAESIVADYDLIIYEQFFFLGKHLAEKYNKPVFVLTDSEDGGLKGSGRSIEAYSMFEEMSRVKELMSKFGGHPMAAGLSLPKDNLEAFRQRLNSLTTLQESDFVAKVSIDVPMPVSYITENLVDQLKIMEPFGCANPKPLFAQKNMSVLSARILGARRNVLKMRVADEQGYEMDAIYFGNIDDFNKYLSSQFPANEVEYMYHGRKNCVRLSFTYYPDVNEFRGTKTLQLIIQNYQ